MRNAIIRAGIRLIIIGIMVGLMVAAWKLVFSAALTWAVFIWIIIAPVVEHWTKQAEE